MISATMATLKQIPFRLLLAVAAMSCAAVLMGAACSAAEQAPATQAGSGAAAGSAAADNTTSGSTTASSSATTTSGSTTGSSSATTGSTGSSAGQAGKAVDPSMYASLSGDIPIDGSSTVFPITEAVAEQFGGLTDDNVRVVVGISGTGGGFKKFCANETVISDASRPIKQKEVDLCAAAGVEYIELPVAIDGLSVVVNPENDFVDCMSVEQLNKIWSPESEGVVTHWNQVNPEWPAEEIKMYAPGVDSGTFDYFTEAINGDGGVSRGDFVASEDDNVLVQGVAGDKYSIGYFGYAYYVENKDKVKVVPIDGGNGCVAPADEAINNGSYAPLSRPLFIYVRSDAAQQEHIAEFVRYYLSPSGQELAASVGYIPFPQEVYDLGLTKFNSGTVGTVFGGDDAFKGPVTQGLSGGAITEDKMTHMVDYASLSGDIPIDGSSTVFPITEAVAEQFGGLTDDNVRVVVGISGTGGGFKKFCANETVISDASRPIKQKEVDLCAAAGVEYIELPVAIDGLSVVVNPENDFVDCMSVEQLNKIWSPESEGVVTHWNQVNPEWPAEEIKMYAPGVDSGTFDYFTEAINGDGGVSRGDFVASEDDNVLVQGVAGDKYSIGYFGYAYYVENKDKVKVVPIDGGNGCVAPADEAINNGSYAPLSRPLFIYVRSDAAQQEHIAEFVRYYLSPSGQELAASVGYIPFPQEVYDLGLTKFNSGTVGTVFGGDNAFKGPVTQGLMK